MLRPQSPSALKKTASSVDMPSMMLSPVLRAAWARSLAVLALVAALLVLFSTATMAQDGHAAGVLEAGAPMPAAPGTTELGALGAWKAVYVVGEVDGTTGPTTLQYVSNARRDAEQMRALGFAVVEFYPPDNSWADIVAAAADAHAIIYAGHGMRWGGSDALVGGMKLNAAESVHPDQIGSDLHMAPGAVAILMHACYSAGTSEEDVNGTTFETAQRRVALYSLPFLEAGLTGYYASWYYGFPAAVLTSLASGLTLGQAYEAYHDYGAETVTRLTHPLSSGDSLWLDYDDWSGWEGRQYNYAFAGDPHLLFGQGPPPTLALSQAALAAYALPGAAGQTFSVQVLATGGAPPPWDAWVEGGPFPWVTLEPRPAEGQLLVHLSPPATVGGYAAQVIVQPQYLPPLRLPVSLDVGYLTLLPAVSRTG